MTKNKVKIETEEEKKYRELIETIAGNISTLARAVAGLLNGPLKKKALIILLAHSSGQTQFSTEKVLNALMDMEKDWLNK